MSDLVPEEAIEAAALAQRSPSHKPGPPDADLVAIWKRTARITLEAAAPLILAAWIEQRADNYADAAEVFGKRAESLLSERPEGFQAMADRAVGKAIILDQEAVALRRQASVLRGEGRD